MLTAATAPQPLASDRRMLPVSVVVFSRNDQHQLADCLQSCNWSTDIHVVDSGSTDRTREIAAELGASVHQHPSTTAFEQRNWFIDGGLAKNAWQFHIDADERFTPEIVQELTELLGSDGTKSEAPGYVCASKTIFINKVLRHCPRAPQRVRLLHSSRCRFTEDQQHQCQGAPGQLRESLLHLADRGSMLNWFHKLNDCSPASDIRLKSRGQEPSCSIALFWRIYLLRGGWLDGNAGFHYCRMIAAQSYFREIKAREGQLNWPVQTTKLAQNLSVQE
jgi:hypothetical protein